MHVDQLLRALPKTELHLHLEGAVAAGTFAQLAAKHELALPPHGDVGDLYDYDDLTEFLSMYSLVCASMRDHEDFRRTTYECLERCARSGVRYVELFFSPESHLPWGVDYRTMLDGICAGLHDAANDHGILGSLVPAINRELGAGRAVEFVQMVIDARVDEVIGIGLDFNEVGFPPESYGDAFRLAAEAGLHRTSHAGEVGPAANIANGIDLLDCERVDHGYNVVDDIDLVGRCVASQIPFTVCPTTTTYTSSFRDLAAPDHAIRTMYDAGLNIVINSDDPAMFGIDLAGEYRTLHHTMGFSVEELAGMALAGIDAAWVDDDVKQTWRAQWGAEIDVLLASVDD